MSENNQSFNYTYSAEQQKEIKQIRDKYAPPEVREDKMEQLRHLDRSVTKPGKIVSLTVGIIGALLLGIGMSCCMVWTDALFVLGIVVGIVGIALACAAYPIYNYVVKKKRAKIAPEIIRLTDELMK